MERNKKGKPHLKNTEPVTYKRSIMAAFKRQNEGKVCPICTKKLTLAAYRQHLDAHKIEENDDECMLVASYTREEAILLRAGPEITLDDEKDENNQNIAEEATTSDAGVFNPEPDGLEMEELMGTTPGKRRRTADENKEACSGNETEKKVLVEAPKDDVPSRRRSRRIQIYQETKTPEKEVNPVKSDNPTAEEVLASIVEFESEHHQSTSKDDIPYYVKFTIRIMKKILSTQKFGGSKYDEKFWSKDDMRIMQRFVSLISLDSKCLFVRLFLRRFGWYSAEKLEQKYTEISNFPSVLNELIKWELIDDDSRLKSLEIALNLADVQILRNVAKTFKIDQNRGRVELIGSLRNFAGSQKSIFGASMNVENAILRNLKKQLGTCVKIKEEVLDLFRAFYTLYCPNSTNSILVMENPRVNIYQEMLYSMLQLETGANKLPSQRPCPNVSSFFNNRKQLFDYIQAKSLEIQMINKMTNNGLSGLEAAFELALKAKDLIDEVPRNERRTYNELPIYERKFSTLWVLTRCCGHGATVLEKMKKYGMAVEWQKYLLTSQNTANYCLDNRGVWWDRMLLNLDSHLKEKEECIKMVKEALNDENVLEKELLMIQDRAIRLLKNEHVPLLVIGEPVKKTISSRVLSKDLGDGRVNRFVIRNEKEEDVECSVEEVVRLKYFELEGFTHGIHDEGATWHTIFGTLFYDIIFDMEKYPDTWLSELQDCPTDMSNCLYFRRKDRFDERFDWLRNAEESEIDEVIRTVWGERSNEANRECSWKLFPDGVDGFLNFLQCIPKQGMIMILQRLAKNYRNCRSGFPDLTLWNPETKQFALVEVKGPGDRLSTKQRLWLDHFQKSGIRAEVCHVTAENEKKLLCI